MWDIINEYPAGNVWVGNGFNDTKGGFSEIPPEAQSTQFPAYTMVVFFGVEPRTWMNVSMPWA